MTRMPRFEREKQLKRKKHQRYLVNTAGAMGLAAGAARVPGAAKVIASRVPKAAGVKPVASLARRADVWTPRSNALAGMGGAVGAASSLTWGRQLKSDVKREEKQLGIKKRDGNRRNANLSAGAVGAGTATAGLGALAGGIPKGKVDVNKPTVRGAYGGGILGYRTKAHQKALKDIGGEVQADKGRWAESQTDEFFRHRKAGKLAPERKIIRSLQRGHKAGRGALYGGAALAGAGAVGVAANRRRTSYDRPKSPYQMSKAARVDPRDYQGRQERSGAKLVGGGAAVAGGAGGVSAALNRYGNKWKGVEQASLKAAGKEVPGLRGLKRPVAGDDWHKVGQALSNQSQSKEGWDAVRRAGRHHGRATQAKYFSDTFRRNSRAFKGVAGAGAGVAAYGAYKMARNRPYGRAELRKADVVYQPRWGSAGVSGQRMVEVSKSGSQRDKDWWSDKRGSYGAISEGRHRRAAVATGVTGGLVGGAAGAMGAGMARRGGRAQLAAGLGGAALLGGGLAARRSSAQGRYGAERRKAHRMAQQVASSRPGSVVDVDPKLHSRSIKGSRAARQRYINSGSTGRQFYTMGPGGQLLRGKMKPETSMSKKDNDELGRKIGAATNTAGAIAGPAALYGAIKSRKEGGVPRGFTRDFGNAKWAQRKTPKAAAKARKVADYLDSPKSKPARVAAGVAAGTAIGLQTANWAGDAIAARTLSKKPQPVSKANAKQRKRKARQRAYAAQQSSEARRAAAADAQIKAGVDQWNANQRRVREIKAAEAAKPAAPSPTPSTPRAASAPATTAPARAARLGTKGKVGLGVAGATAAGAGGYALYRRRRSTVGKSETSTYWKKKRGKAVAELGAIGLVGAGTQVARQRGMAHQVAGKTGFVPGSGRYEQGPLGGGKYHYQLNLWGGEKLQGAARRAEARRMYNKLPKKTAAASGALVAGGLGYRAYADRQSKVRKRSGSEWRGHVSDKAIEAHDKTLPRYIGHKQQDMFANATAGVVGAGMVRRGAKGLMRSGRPSPGKAALAGAGTLTALAGASGARRNYKGALEVEQRREKIRARGWQRRDDSLQKMAKMLKPPKPPQPKAAGVLKPTAGMKQRSFTRSSSVRTNPSGTMSSVSGTTR